MHISKKFFVVPMLFCLTACSPLMRGFTDTSFIATSMPAVTMSSSLPTMADGRGSCFVQSKELAFLTPDYWMRVSGTKFEEPMTVMMYAVAPFGYIWSGNAESYVDNEEIGKITLDGNKFSVVLRAVPVKTDPFAPLFFTPDELKNMEADTQWLAVRYVDPCADNWRTKLILEYREPMPKSVVTGTRPDKQLDNADIQQLLRRAQTTFTFYAHAPKDITVPTAPFFHAPINGKKLGKFLGALEVDTPPMMNDPF